MGYKMKGFSGFGNSPAKQKRVPKKKETLERKMDKATKFKGTKTIGSLNIEKPKVDPDAPGTPGQPGYEPSVHVTDYLTKDKSSGPWEKENKPSRKEIEDSYVIGEKLENFDTPSDVIDHQMKTKKKD